MAGAHDGLLKMVFPATYQLKNVDFRSKKGGKK